MTPEQETPSDASVFPEVADEMPEVDCPCLPMDWGCPLCVLDDSAYITSNTREDN